MLASLASHRLALALACLLVCTRSADGDPLRTVSRLGPPPGAADAISVALDDTHRDVLFAHPRFPLPVGAVTWKSDAPSKAVVHVPLPEEQRFASHLVVSAQLRLRRQTIDLPPRVVAVEQTEEGPAVRVPIEHPFLASPLARSAEAIRLTARPAPVEPVIAAETDPVSVPAGSQLAVGFGFLPDAPASGPTRFRIRACREDDCTLLFEEEATPGARPGWTDRRVPVPDALAAGTRSVAPESRRLVFRFEAIREPGEPRDDHPACQVEDTLDRGARWLRENHDRRRFLFLHTFEVHTPYAPPPGFQALFLESGWDPKPLRRLPERFRPIEYDREIRYTDAQLERFFGELEAEGLLADTVVILTSDHGEEFLEHGALVHGPAVHREVLHVPLILRGPGVARGRRISQPVSGVDLMATALDLAGVEAAVAAGRGRSLAPFVRPTSQASPEAVPIFSEARANVEIRPDGLEIERRTVEVPVFSVQLGDRKLIRHPGGGRARFEYFHLDEDPGELQDRWDPENPEAAALRALLERHLQETAARRRELLERSARSVERPEGLDPERIEKLRALGYIE